MNSVFKDFKRLVDISEEGERLAQEEKEQQERAKGADEQPVYAKAKKEFSLPGYNDAEVMVKRTEAAFTKKQEEYQKLLGETKSLRTEYDDFRSRTEKELKTMKRALAQEQKTTQCLKKAAEGGENVDQVYMEGLQRQIETLKERTKTAEAEVTRQERRCNQAERARELLEAERKHDLETMNTRMEAWKERAEANQQVLLKEIEELRERKGAAPPAGTGGETRKEGDAAEPEGGRERELEAAVQQLNKELEDVQWVNLQTEAKLNETRQVAEEKAARIRSLEEDLERGRRDVSSKAQELTEQAGVYTAKILVLEQQIAGHGAELELAKSAEAKRSEALGEEHVLRQREAFELRRKVDAQQQQLAQVLRQLDDEKESVRQLMSHLDEVRDENRRKEESFSELYSDDLDSRARLQALEAQALINTKALHAKEELVEQQEMEKRSLMERCSGLLTELNDTRAAAKEAEVAAAASQRAAQRAEQARKDLQFEYERAQSELQHIAGDEKESKHQLESKEDEAKQLRQRLAERDSKIAEILRARDEVAAKLRAAEAKASTSVAIDVTPTKAAARRSRSIGFPRSHSPASVHEILQSAADGGGSGRGGVRAPSLFSTTRAMSLLLVALFVLFGIYWSSGVVTSHQEDDLRSTVDFLRSMVASQHRALDTCRTACDSNPS
ncbi:hypothetical protein DIPPA_22984 [Diplonema papillatum]|nr:hypothetical protein DIPPA_22984 [Diplonema papillatum]